METLHPLHNPRVEELAGLELPEAEAVPVMQMPTAAQLPLFIEDSWQGRMRVKLADLWARARRREVEIELMPFWRTMAAPFAVVTAILTVIGLFVAGLFSFNIIAPQIPLQYISGDERWQSVDKSIILLVPIGLFIIEMLILRMVYSIFNYDRRLSVMISWTLAIVNLLIIVAAIQIYALSSKLLL